MELPYSDQLSRKRDAVVRAFESYWCLADCKVMQTEPAPSLTGYRLRAKLVVSGDGIGLFADGSHSVVDLESCLVLSSAVKSALRALRGFPLHQHGVNAVDIREVDGGILVTLAAENPQSLSALATELGERMPNAVSIATSARMNNSPRVLGAVPNTVWGPNKARHTLVAGMPYHYACHGAFTQVNSSQTARVHEHIQRVLSNQLGGLAGRRVLELFAGEGALALRLAGSGAFVTVVEGMETPIAFLAQAAEEQSLSVTGRWGDAGCVLEKIIDEGHRFDALLVNPPRRGLSPQMRREIATVAPRVAIYTSCCPQTLARDAADMARLGLRVAELRPFDMIPLSDCVESTATFVPAEPIVPRVIFEDRNLIVVDKPGHEPTTIGGDERGSLLGRVRRQCGAPRAVALHSMHRELSGPCMFGRSKESAALLAQTVSRRVSTAVALVKGIARRKGVFRLHSDNEQISSRLHYTRVRVLAGHSLLTITVHGNDVRECPRLLAGIGHPIIGNFGWGDVPTNEFFKYRHWLDRSFIHISSVTVLYEQRSLVLASELAYDLGGVGKSLAG